MLGTNLSSLGVLDFSVFSVPKPTHSVHRATLNIEDTGQSHRSTAVDSSNIQGRASGSGGANMLWQAVAAGGNSVPICQWLLTFVMTVRFKSHLTGLQGRHECILDLMRCFLFCIFVLLVLFFLWNIRLSLCKARKSGTQKSMA